MTTTRIMLGVLAADSGNVRRNGAELDLEARRTVGYHHLEQPVGAPAAG